jgi:hypothetical protein
LGTAFLEKAHKADVRGYGYKLSTYDSMNTALLIYCHNGDRIERVRRFEWLCSCACVQLNIETIIGIATDNFSALGHSYDFTVVKAIDIPPDERSEYMNSHPFAKPTTGHFDEWQQDTQHAPPTGRSEAPHH